MTYCHQADNLNRTVHDFKQIQKERAEGAARMKRMAWDASAKLAHHHSICPTCQKVPA